MIPSFSRDQFIDCGYFILLMAIVTALEVQKRNKERVNVFLDGEYAFSLTLIEAAKLHKGQTLSETAIAELQDTDSVQRAVDTAARFLANRPRSEAEVRRNLHQKKIDEQVIEQAVEKLQTMGYLDDAAFARYWLENRDTFKPRGPMALRYELQQKGVASSIIDAVLQELDSEDAAYRAAQSQIRRLQGISRQAFRQKLGSFLQRRGFDYSVSRDIIEQLMNEIVADHPDYFMEDEM